MPLWVRTLLARLQGKQVETHTLSIEISSPGHDVEEAGAMTREIEAEVARQLSEGSSPEVTRAALEEITRRHGATLDAFEDD